MDKIKADLQKAQAYAFLLLKFRPRSENELAARLKRKKFDEGIIRQTIDFLKDKEFIDDSLFAKAWINARLKKNLGIRRVRQELESKGVNPRIIDSHIDNIRKSYSEADVVRNLIDQRAPKLKGVDPLKARRRLYSYLVRRGFSSGTILEVMNQQ